MGAHLLAMSDLREEAFVEHLYSAACGRIANSVVICEKTLEAEAFRPKQWATDLQKRIRAMCAYLESPTFLVPSDLVVPDPSQTAVAVSGFLRRVANLLLWWPTIVDRTRLLKADGISLACALRSTQR
jgi:hypothetical protein